jgi:hypothetical protein
MIGIAGLFVLRSTIIQVDFEGGSATGYLQSGRVYSIVGISSTRVYAEVRGTLSLTSDYGAQEILRQEISLFFDPGDEIGIFHETTISVTEVQVDRSGEYELSYEPSYIGTSGKIAVQESLIRSLLGIDEVLLVIVGAVGMIVSVIVILVIKKKSS